jgi:outer membrane protein TolC
MLAPPVPFEPAATLSLESQPVNQGSESLSARGEQEVTLSLQPQPVNQLPISLDTVLRLAEEQNAKVGQAREQVRQAYAEAAVAKTKWVPDIYVGTAFYRHEGGIQNEDGTLTHSSTGAMFAGLELDGKFDIREIAFQQVNAQRKVWQQKGELSRVTSETLLDAATTYIDFLTARTGEGIARELEGKLTRLLKDAENLASVDKPARGEVWRIQAELEAQRQTVIKLRTQAAGAAAKLIYLLQLDPCTELVPVDSRLIPLDLIDATPCLADLVNQSLAAGPGVREMEGLLALIQKNMERAKGPGRYLPILEMRMAEGGFGAGPGDRLDWDNRWDLGLQARWNLASLFGQKDRQRATQAQIQQVHLAYADLRGKLAAGVQESRETILGGRQEITLGQSQISNAQEALDFSERRQKEVPGMTQLLGDVLLGIGSLGRAQMNYITAVGAYDKAQIRLMVLLGPAACKPAEAK